MNAPTRFDKYFCVAVMTASLTAALGLFRAAQLRWAWVEVRQEHARYLKLDTQQVRVMHSGWSLGPADCRTRTVFGLATDAGLSESEVRTICGWFDDPGFVPKVEKTVADQRTGFLIFDLIALCLTRSSYRLFSRTMAARDMGKRIEGRRKRNRAAIRHRRDASTQPAVASATERWA